MEKKTKLLKDVKAGDTIYYLPGRFRSDGTESITKETVSKVELDEECGEIVINIFIDGFNNNEYPEISYSESELNLETFVNSFGYYSTQENGIQPLFNEVYKSNIRIAREKAYDYVFKINEEIKEFHKNLLRFSNTKKNPSEDELVVVPKSLIKNMLAYCENQSVYDKLSDYDDFYYKLKKEINS